MDTTTDGGRDQAQQLQATGSAASRTIIQPHLGVSTEKPLVDERRSGADVSHCSGTVTIGTPPQSFLLVRTFGVFLRYHRR